MSVFPAGNTNLHYYTPLNKLCKHRKNHFLSLGINKLFKWKLNTQIISTNLQLPDILREFVVEYSQNLFSTLQFIKKNAYFSRQLILTFCLIAHTNTRRYPMAATPITKGSSPHRFRYERD
jgi:hypothetical protein